jgi:hypothetical protein
VPVGVGATPTASQSAADGGASAHLLAVAAEQNGQKEKKIKLAQILFPAVRIFQRRERVGFERIAPWFYLSKAKVGNSIQREAGQKKEFSGWKIQDSKGKQQQLERPR